jgi:pimeloyl-ACP methyl ester carboxylesterase
MDVANARTGQVIAVTTAILDDVDTNAGRLDIPAAARRVDIPWLILHGTDDESVPFVESGRLHDASGGRARTVPIEGAGHTFGAAHPWRPPVPATERVFDETVAFLAGALL